MSDEKDKRYVILGGERVHRDAVKKKYRDIGLLSKPTAKEIIQLLINQTEPLSTSTIASAIRKDRRVVGRILRELKEAEIILSFSLGGRVQHYAITEYGAEKALRQKIITEIPVLIRVALIAAQGGTSSRTMPALAFRRVCSQQFQASYTSTL